MRNSVPSSQFGMVQSKVDSVAARGYSAPARVLSRLARGLDSSSRRDRAAACLAVFGLAWLLVTAVSVLLSPVVRVLRVDELWRAKPGPPPAATKTPSGLDWYFANADPRVPFDYETRRLNPAGRSGCSNSRIWIDVGANVKAMTTDRFGVQGEAATNFGKRLTIPSDLLGSASVFAFEPQLVYYHSLKDQGRCVFPFNAAAGKPAGPAEFSVSKNGHSSSLLPPAEGGGLEELKVIENADGSTADWRKEVSTVLKTSVMMVPLDDVISRLPACRVEFLKVDAQGFDLKVCQSAGDWIKVVDFVEVEAAAEGAKCLYEGCSERTEVLAYFKGMGFELIGDDNSCCSETTKVESNLYYVNTAHKDVAIGPKCPGEGCAIVPLSECHGH
jgi:FkbM family methyltransferase